MNNINEKYLAFPDRENWERLCNRSKEAGHDLDIGGGVGFDFGSKMFGEYRKCVIGKLFTTEQEARDYLTNLSGTP